MGLIVGPAAARSFASGVLRGDCIAFRCRETHITTVRVFWDDPVSFFPNHLGLLTLPIRDFDAVRMPLSERRAMAERYLELWAIAKDVGIKEIVWA